MKARLVGLQTLTPVEDRSRWSWRPVKKCLAGFRFRSEKKLLPLNYIQVFITAFALSVSASHIVLQRKNDVMVYVLGRRS